MEIFDLFLYAWPCMPTFKSIDIWMLIYSPNKFQFLRFQHKYKYEDILYTGYISRWFNVREFREPLIAKIFTLIHVYLH